MFALAFGQVRLQGFGELVEIIVIPKKKTGSTEKESSLCTSQGRSCVRLTLLRLSPTSGQKTES